MVALQDIRASNVRIKSSLPAGLVGVFIGATNGIGETTLREFARHTNAPRAYFVGRSRESGDRIAAECKRLNPEAKSFSLTKRTFPSAFSSQAPHTHVAHAYDARR